MCPVWYILGPQKGFLDNVVALGAKYTRYSYMSYMDLLQGVARYDAAMDASDVVGLELNSQHIHAGRTDCRLLA